MRKWLLPEYVDDVLPAEAHRLEALRRTLLDLFATHGYELVVPPLVEYVDSLLAGAGPDVELTTFKLVDQLSGRLMGLRADTTPQVARIDAHVLNRDGVVRLCYAGPVVRTVPAGIAKRREVHQVGAEIYGHDGIASDLEVKRLTIAALKAAGVASIHLEIGHPAIFRALTRLAGLSDDQVEALFAAVQCKDLDAVARVAGASAPAYRGAIEALPRLFGDADVLTEARALMPASADITQALDELAVLTRELAEPGVRIGVDLAELSGYRYERGVTFHAYARHTTEVSGAPIEIARGGRYEIGSAFGRHRPATGFSIDLRELAAIAPTPSARAPIHAPASGDASLAALVASLRAAGETVMIDLQGSSVASSPSARRVIERASDGWRVVDKT